jgi:DNA-binding transcriptional MocR family regulator
VAQSNPADQIPAPVESSQLTLVDQLVQWGRRRIDERVFRSGMRMPSIRKLALDKGVSRFTVVEAYERLVAAGYLDSRRGSGFYVREPLSMPVPYSRHWDALGRRADGFGGGASPTGPNGETDAAYPGAYEAAHEAATSGTSGVPGTPSNAAGARPAARDREREAAAHAPVTNSIDVVWLLRNMMHTASPEKGPGIGYLPNRWMNGDLLANAMRAIGRQGGAQMLLYGNPLGFRPLREQLRTRLAELEIGATPEQFVLTSGITQAIDLLARIYVQAGDAVLVGDPAWFQMFGRFASQGARLVGVPYTREGPDLVALQQLVQTWRPKLLLINSVLHNPTGTSLTAAQAFRILQLAEEYDFIVVEDDVYGDLCPPGYAATRLASLDQLKRVIYLGSFSKTLAANLRVGFVAGSPEVVRALSDQKMLTVQTTPEINERLLFKVLTEGHYRRHVERLRARLDTVRDKTARALEKVGFELFCTPGAGMFLWADTGVDSAALAAAGHEEGYLLAPGSLFSPHQSPSTFMRFNVANCGDPALLAFLLRYVRDRVR